MRSRKSFVMAIVVAAVVPLSVAAGTLTVEVQPAPPGIPISLASSGFSNDQLLGMLVGFEFAGFSRTAQFVATPFFGSFSADVPGLVGASSGSPGQFAFIATQPLMAATIYAWTAQLAFDVCCNQFGNDVELTPGSSYGWPVSYAGLIGPPDYPDGMAYYRDPMRYKGAYYGDLYGTLRLDWYKVGGVRFVNVIGDMDAVRIVPEPATWPLAASAAALLWLLRQRGRN
jgi:hypothetical protein